MEDDLESRLTSSPAGQSILAELGYLAALRRLGWYAIHGCYYTDHKTDKLREIDVLGKRTWRKKLAKGSIDADLHLVIEAKSLKDYHLIFSPLNKSQAKPTLLHEAWVGNEASPFFRQLARAMAAGGLNPESVHEMMQAFQQVSYPDDYLPLIGELSPRAPDAPCYSTAFRETNIGGEKELDNSVLWRAIQSLQSAVSSLQLQYLDEFARGLASMIEDNIASNGDPSAFVLDAFVDKVRRLQIYHPIVVVNAPLWIITADRIRKVRWCRFEQQSVYEYYGGWWLDVVHSSHFTRYATDLTAYYRKHFSALGAKTYRMQAQLAKFHKALDTILRA